MAISNLNGTSTLSGNNVMYPSLSTLGVNGSSHTYNSYLSLKDNCTELYKQLLWYNVKKHGKDMITDVQHKNMLSMLNSNDKDTLELLRQILIGKAIDEES